MSPTLKAVLTPGSTGFLMLCLMGWTVLRFVWPGTRETGRVWLTLVGVTYVLLALPIVAGLIADGLPGLPAGGMASDHKIETLVVLDGDNRVARVTDAVRLYRTGVVSDVVVLGDGWLVGALETAGVPKARTRVDASPATTRAQIEWLQGWMAKRPDARLALIASRLQMPRVAALAHAAGLNPRLVSSPIDDEPPTTGAWRMVPMYIALRVSRDALYEHAALAYYRWQGWISGS
jgi:uncharacterized SAM-binding protein YcdF (DUF218 family)